MEKAKRNHEIAFLVFMVLVAALGNQNPSFRHPQILWSFLALLIFNLLNLTAIHGRLTFEKSAMVSFVGNNLLIASILYNSGGKDSYFWVLLLMPIFTSCLSLEKRALYGIFAFEAALLGFFYAGSLADREWLDLAEWASKSATLIVCGAVTWNAVQGESRAKRALQEEHERVERDKHEMTQRLQHADRLATVGTLVASLAHEINNPLTAILGIAGIHQSGAVSPESWKKDVEVVADAARRCARILQDLLAFSRKQKGEPGPHSVNELLKQCLAFKKYDWTLQKIKVIEEYDATVPEIRLVPSQFQQVAFNLLTNAQQAMAAANGGGRIWVRTQRVGQCVRVMIEDDGPGISPEVESKIFEPFFTTKPAGVGTGLGLSISKQLMQSFGGSLSVRSSLGRGATFILELPIHAQGETASLKAQAAPATSMEAAPRILIAEDEAPILDILKRILKPAGLSIQVVGSFNEALAEIRKDPPDLLVTDLRMPGMEPQEFFDILEAEGRIAGLRILAITGSMADNGFEELLRRRGIPYVSKPFSVGEIKEVILRALGDRWKRFAGRVYA